LPNTGPSIADRALLAALAERGVTVSHAQLERWRAAELLPRNARHGRGRGRGSTSTTPPGTLPIALALARHTQQGRPLHDSVLRWFLAAGLTASDAEPVPEPPFPALQRALLWYLDRQLPQPDHPLPDAADDPDAHEAAVDDLAERVQRSITRRGLIDPWVIDQLASLVRTGKPLPGSRTRARAARDSTAAVLLANAAGAAEVGNDAIAANLRVSGLIPERLVESVSAQLLADELTGGQFALSAHQDQRQRLLVATHEQLLTAREQLGLLGAYAAVINLLSMSGVVDDDITRLRNLYEQHSLWLLLVGLPHLDEPAWAVPFLLALLDPRLAWAANYLRQMLEHHTFTDLDALLAASVANLRNAAARDTRGRDASRQPRM
jgi:hypothetical protein